MARQSTTPVQFQRSQRQDTGALMSSGDPGQVTPVGMIPVLRGDSLSGSFAIDIRLAEMPRPLLNGVVANVQAWFVPKSAHPQFNGHDEFMASYTGTQIEALGADPRDPPVFFNTATATADAASADPILKSLGIHPVADESANYTFHDDLHDAFALIYNFRLAAHSNKLERAKYYREDATAFGILPRAFWPQGNRSGIVPDYERALIVGDLSFDVQAGQVPINDIKKLKTGTGANSAYATVQDEYVNLVTSDDGLGVRIHVSDEKTSPFGELEGQNVSMTLADIDKARETQAFAKLRAAMAGNDATGFTNDDAIMADLMSGLSVPETEFRRPWLLDSQRIPFGMTERSATDGASLDQSITTGQAQASLRLNLPQQDIGGVIIITAEVLPERIDERMSEEWLQLQSVDELPDALRDIQRIEPVDDVPNRRIDARHTEPGGLYGFEPMNSKWNRNYTRLGGAYYQDDPGNPWTEQRSAIWMANVVDPDFTEDHFLAPAPFPKYVFSDTTADGFEFVARHSCVITGLTQIGDVLHENTDDYAAITESEE